MSGRPEATLRVWDVSPGYLNRGSLLGEHREIHAVLAILKEGKRGYANHPETLRWRGHLEALCVRHAVVVAEMELRGYVDRTPVLEPRGHPTWPEVSVTPPIGQFHLLDEKYERKAPGRIPLPRTPQELWAQHKYSTLARDQALYRSIGRAMGRDGRAGDRTMADLTEELVGVLRIRPTPGGLVNALDHMWGHVAEHAAPEERSRAARSTRGKLAVVRELATRVEERYLLHSTALGELGAFV